MRENRVATLVASKEAGGTRMIDRDVEDFNLAKAKKLGGWTTANGRRESLDQKGKERTKGEAPDAPVIAVGVSSHIDESLGLIREICVHIDARSKYEVAIRSVQDAKACERRKTDEFQATL
jgi:hypothetical protein